MYERFFGLTDKPFALTPNPKFVFYSQQYREAEGQLLYGINNREGFMLVTGQPGTGKTTLCRDLIEKLDKNAIQSALIFNPFLNGTDMLAALLTEFGVGAPPQLTRKELYDRLNQFLLAQLVVGKGSVAIFDEAQHLTHEFLEQVRVLSNLETDSEKLIQIVLVGQPELLDKLASPTMAQLDQRVSIRCALRHLDENETERYISHRLNVAGSRGELRFQPKAMREIHRLSGGVPRMINLLCDRALLAGYASRTREIGPAHVRKASSALRGGEPDASVVVDKPRRRVRPLTVVLSILLLASIAAAGLDYRPIALLRGAEAPVASSRTAARVNPVVSRMKAMMTSARTRLAGGDTTAACAALPDSVGALPPSAAHLTRELEQLASVCAARKPVASVP